MKFRIEIVMLTQWLKRCVMAQKDKSRGGLWAAILDVYKRQVPHTVRGLELEKEYTLTEKRAPDGYAEAESLSLIHI